LDQSAATAMDAPASAYSIFFFQLFSVSCEEKNKLVKSFF
jgi:hypothetical protein